MCFIIFRLVKLPTYSCTAQVTAKQTKAVVYRDRTLLYL